MRGRILAKTIGPENPWFVLLAGLLLVQAVQIRLVARRDVPGHPPTPTEAFSISQSHPRCIFQPEGSGGRTFQVVRRLFREDSTFRRIMSQALAQNPGRQHPAANAACWAVSDEDRYARAAVERMLREEPTKSGGGAYSNVWSFALAYDWLFHHPAFAVGEKRVVESKIVDRIRSELEELDGTGMALWHGRNQAANGLIDRRPRRE
ncbi:MAG TPA: hypothetical protein P5568_01530 [Acidobacteriota bacterium]|nr:hypothetical protein [Acidobacteriota bacterium]